MSRTEAPPLPDQAARDAIAGDLGTTSSSAAAGGKTESLVQRMVALADGAAPVERISAVTFTIKAAAELAEIPDPPEQAARSSPKSGRLEQALARLDAAFVGLSTRSAPAERGGPSKTGGIPVRGNGPARRHRRPA
jgi:hypothetical protein